ncbi:MAG: hypothetical protein ABGY08_05955 [Gammaproteobacteria bacterium]
MPLFILLAIMLASYQLYYSQPFFEGEPVVHGPGQIAPYVPDQYPLSEDAPPFQHNGFRIIPLANFEVTARVLHRYDYAPTVLFFGSPIDDLSPVDLALGWMAMSDERYLDQIEISQSKRWYKWRVEQFPIPRREIEINSANMHFVPASSSIENKIKQVVKGDMVSFKGYLIKIEKGNWNWTSSLTRNDTGARACETIWVEEFKIL